MEQATAWILDIGRDIKVAIGKYEMVHLIENPTLVNESRQGKYSAYSLNWQGEQIPVADIATSLGQNSSETKTSLQPEIVAIVAYEADESTEPKYGGLVLNSIPDRQLVSNDQACRLPEPQEDWLNVAIACFSDKGQTTPVLNLPRIFSN
jgi:hypothetical protein